MCYFGNQYLVCMNAPQCSKVAEKKRIQGPPPVSPSYDSWAYLPSWFMDVYGTQISCYIMFNIYHKPQFFLPEKIRQYQFVISCDIMIIHDMSIVHGAYKPTILTGGHHRVYQWSSSGTTPNCLVIGGSSYLRDDKAVWVLFWRVRHDQTTQVPRAGCQDGHS